MSFQENIPSVYIPRPPNAFICFRSRFVRDQKAQGSQGSGMKDISRQAGHIWNEMTEEERRPYVELSDRIKQEHRATYPDYKFNPAKRGSSKSVRAPRRRPQATSSQRSRSHERELSTGWQSYTEGYNPMPTLSSPFTPPPSHGQLYLPADISSAKGREEVRHSPHNVRYLFL